MSAAPDLHSIEIRLSSHAQENMPQKGKASSQDIISAELVKIFKSLFLPTIPRLIVDCWDEGKKPQDFRDAKIVNYYKKKGKDLTAITAEISPC